MLHPRDRLDPIGISPMEEEGDIVPQRFDLFLPHARITTLILPPAPTTTIYVDRAKPTTWEVILILISWCEK